MAGTKYKATVLARVLILLVLGVVALFCVRFFRHDRFRLPVGNVTPMVSLGETHGVILASDGSLWSWGADFLGWPVLGLGAVSNQTSLRRIGSDTDWVNVSAAPDANLAVKSDGTLWGWGANYGGQLGGATNVMRNRPGPSAPGNDWKQAAAGHAWSLALKTNGTLWAWGNNWCGQLGIGSRSKSPVPVQVGTGTNWTRVWAHDLQSVGQQSDGSLWVWGDNPEFHQGTNSFVEPRRLSPDTNWVQVGFGTWTAFGLKSDGTLWTWGRFARAYAGQAPKSLDEIDVIPKGTTNLFDTFFDIYGSAIPLRVGTNANWKSISESRWWYQTLQKRDGSLWVLDATEYNEIKAPTAYKPIRIWQVDLKKEVAAFASGNGHGVAPGSRAPIGVVLTREGEVWTWGMVLGERSSLVGSLKALTTKVAGLFNLKTHWQDPKPVLRDEPWQLPHQEP